MSRRRLWGRIGKLLVANTEPGLSLGCSASVAIDRRDLTGTSRTALAQSQIHGNIIIARQYQ